MEDDPDAREQIFHNTVRENVIFFLLFILLYIFSFAIIERFRRRDQEDYFSVDDDDETVFKISLWLCTFALGIAVGAALLLPISILSNEVLLLYPSSWYVQWLNHSLIQGMWNHVFLFSNLSLFAFLPFAYLFTESEGFFGFRKGILGRVYETLLVLLLLSIIVLGMTFVISSLIDDEHSKLQTLLNIGNYYLPFLYSCISSVGALILLLCTPLGFVQLFGVVGKFLIKPKFMRDLDEEFIIARLEENSLKRRLNLASSTGKSYLCPAPMLPGPDDFMVLQNGALQLGLSRRVSDVKFNRKLLDKQRHTSVLLRNLLYPGAMLVLLVLTVIAVLIVVENTLALLIGMKALPLSKENFTLGISSLSKLGVVGATLEIVLIFYLVATSSVGLYTLPLVNRLRPRIRMTPFTHIVANCTLLLILSSALPLLSRILGFTNFDLLGDFGKVQWLGNLKIVVMYNIVFALCITLCLVYKFPKEFWIRLLSSLGFPIRRRQRHSSVSWNVITKED